MLKKPLSLLAAGLLMAVGAVQPSNAYVVVDYFAGGGTYPLAADSDYIYTQSGKFNNDGTYASAGASPGAAGGSEYGFTEWGNTFYRSSGTSIRAFNKTTGVLQSTLAVTGLPTWNFLHGLTTDGTDFYTEQGVGYSGGSSNVEIWKINGTTGVASLFFDFGTLPNTTTTGPAATTTGYIEDIAWVGDSIYGVDGAISSGSGSSKLWKIDGATVGSFGLGTFDTFEDSPAGLHIEGIDWDGSAFWVHSNWTPVDSDGNFTGDPFGHYYQKLGGFTTIEDPGGTGSVPEPATLALMGLGLLGMGFMKRKHR